MIIRARRPLATAAVLVACGAWLSLAGTSPGLKAGTYDVGSRLQPGTTESAPFAITHGPYLQLPTSTSMTVAWHTNRPGVSRVEYWIDDERARTTAVSSSHGLIDNDRTSHVVRLTGLRPGTTYRYRVVSREFLGYEKQHIVKFGGTAAGEPLSFTTLDPSKTACSFSLVSDIHENAKRLDAMLAGVDWARESFVVFDGDMVNDFMSAGQPFSGFVDVSVSRFARLAPFVYVRGNHDVRGRFARTLADYFPTQNGRAYYSFDHGPAHFIVLDSGEDKVDLHEYYNGLVAFEPYRREQAAWLAADLRSPAARRARYRILFSHIPPRDGSTRTGTPEEGFAIQQVRECWEKVANQGGVDLWLSGHTHRYAHVAPSAGNRYHLIINAPETSMRVDVSRSDIVVSVTRETGGSVDRITIPPR